jgi:two-component system sensor histidine kinase/response regulator
LRKGIILLQQLEKTLSTNSKVLGMLVMSLMLLSFTIETFLLFDLLDASKLLNSFSYILVILSIIFSYFVINDFIERVSLREEKINTQLKAIDKTHIISVVDIDGIFLSANKNFAKTVKYKQDDLIGKNCSIFVPKYYVNTAEYKNAWNQLKHGKPLQGEFEHVTKYGISVWIQASYTPLKNSEGNYNKILMIGVDITRDRLRQIEITQKNSYLEYAAKILRHDMHSGINTYIPRGIRALKRRLTSEQIQQLNIDSPLKLIEGGLAHAQKVYVGVKEFTNLVKSDIQITKEVLDLSQILTKFVTSTAYSKQVSIGELPKVHVNESLFCTAIDNLIRNGLKYNDSETRQVKIYMEGKTTLCVEDNGRGMTQEEFEYLSQPYTRKNNQKENGSGLGLNICMAILKEHGFSMTAEKIHPGTILRIKLKGVIND